MADPILTLHVISLHLGLCIVATPFPEAGLTNNVFRSANLTNAVDRITEITVSESTSVLDRIRSDSPEPIFLVILDYTEQQFQPG